MFPALLLFVLAVLPPDVVKVQRVAAPEYSAAILRAVELVERPDLEVELWRVCRREGWCGRYGVVGIHPRDAWVGRKAYRSAVAMGRLDPEACPAHRITADRPFAAFATRGGFGTIATLVLWRLGPCVGPEALDDPEVAAEAAARFMAACYRWTGARGDRHTRSCTCVERTARWMGPGRWATRTHAERRRASTRQCGPQPELELDQEVEDVGTLVARSWRRWARVVVAHWRAWRSTSSPDRTLFTSTATASATSSVTGSRSAS